ncbi:MAG: response regulator transcription factor [Candidatus Eremiobacteraeota bacterium]|nr:response regulator transcription factor [Candidatus Eremiobacteraeota bacterium]MBV8366377.1 response regulator transcription factor [Candidatus Eremiobacteraeota bacterium]
MIRVALVDDHPIVREGLVSALGGDTDLQIVGSVGSAGELIKSAQSWRPDVVLLDFEMPGLSGVDAVRELARALPATRVIVFTAFGDEDRIVGAVRAGARGYILKGAPAADVAKAIRDVHAGGSYLPPPIAAVLAAQMRQPARPALSEREREVLRCVSDGLSNKQIARRLGITERTVKFHVNSIMTKLGAENRAQAVALAARRRLL